MKAYLVCVCLTLLLASVLAATIASLPDRSACLMKKFPGPCDDLIPRFYFEQTTGKCSVFGYRGCGGNRNNFLTLQECTKTSCLEPKVTGMCLAYFQRYYYSTVSKTCGQFVYGGCGGNQNNFYTQAECERICL